MVYQKCNRVFLQLRKKKLSSYKTTIVVKIYNIVCHSSIKTFDKQLNMLALVAILLNCLQSRLTFFNQDSFV